MGDCIPKTNDKVKIQEEKEKEKEKDMMRKFMEKNLEVKVVVSLWFFILFNYIHVEKCRLIVNMNSA